MYIHIHMTHTYIHAHSQTHSPTHTLTLTHIYTHTPTHTPTHIRTCVGVRMTGHRHSKRIWHNSREASATLVTKKFGTFIYILRPTQSMMYVPLLVNRCQESILLFVQYKYLKSFPEDFMLQDLILRTRLCGTGFASQHCWVVDFCLINMFRRKCFAPIRYQLLKGKSAGLALQYFYMIHRVGRIIFTWICPIIYICSYTHV